MYIPTLKQLKQQKGFTLVEILVVIGILAILLAITLVAINPGQHFIDSRNSQRQANVTAILDAIYEYESNHSGNVPPSLSSLASTPKLIGTATGEIALCADIVPADIADLPIDPSTGTKAAATCDAGNYETGYNIAKSASNRFTVAAPDAEGATISVTR